MSQYHKAAAHRAAFVLEGPQPVGEPDQVCHRGGAGVMGDQRADAQREVPFGQIPRSVKLVQPSVTHFVGVSDVV
jgi:hypothetical protein